MKQIIPLVLFLTLAGAAHAVISAGAAVIDFNGAQHIEVSDNDVFSIQDQMTISFWVRPSDFIESRSDSYVVPVIKGRGGEHEWNFKVYGRDSNGVNKITFGIYNPDGKGVSSYFKEELTSGEWVLITAKVDKNSIYLYKNGIVQDQDRYTGIVTPTNGRAPLRIGTGNGRDFFDGNIADVAIFSRALSGEEIREMYARGPRFRLSANSGNYAAAAHLVAWYKLNDDDSVITDYSATRRSGRFYSNGEIANPSIVDLTASLNNPVSATPAAIPPLADLDFDGQDDVVEIADHNDFSVPSTGQMTISAWIKPSALIFDRVDGTGYVHWMSKGNAGEHEWAFRMYSSENSEDRENRISFYLFNPDGGLGAGSYVQEDVRVGEWIHIVAKIDGERIYIYKNGVLKDSDAYRGAPYAINPQNRAAAVRIGGNERTSFEGAIGDVAIFDRALTHDEVTAIYQGGRGFTFNRNIGSYNGATDLVAWYQLHAGQAITDLSGHEHDGILRT